MAEKRVSVRLAAVGGQQVKSELTGIGDAGKKGFGKASREMEIANAKLAKFARRAKIAAGIMAAAAVTAGIAMVRSGLKTIDEQAKLAASLGTTTASMQVLARAADLAGVSQGEVEQATIMMTKSLSLAAAGTGPAVKALQQLHLTSAGLAKLPIDQKMIAIQDALQKYIPAAQRAGVATQIFGARAGLIFTRIDSAALKQAKKDVVDFGVATSQIDAAQVQRTNDALSRMGLLWRGISNQLAVAAAPALESLANSMADIGKVTGPLGRAIKGLFDNIGKVMRVLGSFAALAAGRFVASMGAAALGLRGVGLSLTAIKLAIASNPLGLLLTGITTLIAFAPQISKAINGWLNPQTKFQVATANVVAAMGDEITQSQLLDAELKRGGIMSAEMARQKLVEAKSRYQAAAATIAEQRAMALGSPAVKAATARIRDNLNSLSVYQKRVDQFHFAADKRNVDILTKALSGNLALRTKLLKAPKAEQDQLALTQKNIDAITAALAKAKDGMVAFGGTIVVPIKATKLLTAESNSLARSLAVAKTHAVALAAALRTSPGALQGLQKQAAILDAGLAAAAKAGSATDVSSAQFRKQLELQLGLSEAANNAENAYISAIINRRVAEHSANAEKQTALNKYLESLGKTGTSANNVASAAAADKAAETAKSAWASASDGLKNYATNAADVGKGIGNALTGAFSSAESAIVEFVKTGKLSFRSLVTSLLADMAKLTAQKYLLGPLSNLLAGALGGGAVFGPRPLASAIGSGVLYHSGGLVGSGGARRSVPASVFAGAPRMHNGGFAGLQPDEVPAILQRGERVLSRAQVAGGGQTVLRVDLSPDLIGSVLQTAQGTSVEIASQAIDIYNRKVLPQRVGQIARNPGVIG